MTEQKAYQILGLEEGASFDEIKHERRILIKKYHQDSEKANREKYDEVEEAYKFLKKIYEEKKAEPSKQVDERPPRNKDPEFTTQENDKKSSKSDQSKLQKVINGTTKKEKAYDELVNFIKTKEKELDKKNIKVRPKYNQELLNIDNLGVKTAKEYKEEQKKLSERFTNIVDSANEYDRLLKTFQKAKEQLLNWGITKLPAFVDEKIIAPQYRGVTAAEEFIRIRNIIEKKLKEIHENVVEADIFLAFLDEEKEKLKGIEPDLNILQAKEDLKIDRGKISARQLQQQRASLSQMIVKKDQIVEEFKKFFLDVSQRINSIYNVSLTDFTSYYENAYNYTEEDLNNVCERILSYEKNLQENSKVSNEFLAYYTNLSESDKELLGEITDINELLKEENRTKYTRTFFRDLKQQLQKLKNEKKEEQKYLEAVTKFYDFFDTKEKELQDKYGVNLNLWKKYRKDKYSLEMLERVKNDLLDYEKDISEKAGAYDEFVEFYRPFSKEEKALFASKINLDNYISKENRLSHFKEDYAKIKEQILEIKEEKELKEKIERDRKAKKEFIIFFKEKEKILKNEFGVTLEKWLVLALEENNFYEEDYLRAKKEILALETELKTKRNIFLAETIGKKNNRFFEEIISEEAKKGVEKIQKEQEKKEALEEFIVFFDTKEKELNKLYGVSLNKWRKYRDNVNLTIKDLKEAYKEITKFDQEVKGNARAYDDFIDDYKKLSDNDKKLYSTFDIEKYLLRENRTLYSKDVYDELKNKVLSYKREKELRKKQERYNTIKRDFIAFFNEKKNLFKQLYNIDLYKWRRYGQEENDFTEDDYFSVREEITTYEDLKENERMNSLGRLRDILRIVNVNIEKYLEEKGKNIKTISINDIGLYLELLFNISYIVAKIKKLNGGEDKLNAFLKEEKKSILEIPASKLEELYKIICIEVTRKDQKDRNQEKNEIFNIFKEFYQAKRKVFKALYGENLSKWDNYLKEDNKNNYNKEDYENVINEIKELEKSLEEKRMSLAFNLQVSLKKLGMNFGEYLNVRKKDLLSISIEELVEYQASVDLIYKITAIEEAKGVLIDYLETNNVKLVELDNDVLLTIDALYEEYKKAKLEDDKNNFSPQK